MQARVDLVSTYKKVYIVGNAGCCGCTVGHSKALTLEEEVRKGFLDPKDKDEPGR